MDVPSWEVPAVLGLIALSAFFSGSETALTALPESKTQQILDSGGRGARALELWHNYPNRILYTILIGNNLVNIAASVLASDLTYRLLGGNWNLAIPIGIMTFLILVFGEITPKSFALHNAERIAVDAIRALTLVYYLFYPVTWLLVKITRVLVTAFGGRFGRRQMMVTEEDIEYLIRLGGRQGALEKFEEEMLESIFEFGDTLIKEVMVPRTDMVAIEDTTPESEVINLVVKSGHSRLPVFHENLDDIMGFIYTKDLLKHLHRDGVEAVEGTSSAAMVEPAKPPEGEGGFELSHYLRPPYYVPEQKKISELLKEFQRRRMHIAVVVDEYGGTAGLVTLEDILEEIVGDIQDEYDMEEKQLKAIDEHRYIADARLSISELEDTLKVKFPEDGDYETLGGFIINQVGAVPPVGSHVIWKNLHFTVREADEKHMVKVEIARRQIPPSTTETE